MLIIIHFSQIFYSPNKSLHSVIHRKSKSQYTDREYTMKHISNKAKKQNDAGGKKAGANNF